MVGSAGNDLDLPTAMTATARPADRLAGKVALVTGAGSRGDGVGTGKAMSVLFAREGARVCLVDIEPDRAKETLSLVRAEGGDALVIEGDVSDADSCANVVEVALHRYGQLDVLVNNAAIVGPVGPVEGLSLEAWQQVLAINLTGAMLMSRHALPSLRPQGGAIINIASTGALVSTGQTPSYGAAKAALIRLTADLAVAYGRDGVRANAIAPGNIHTPMAGGSMTSEARKRRRMASPLATEGNAWDVAWTAVFLASDEARWITGACIPVDGGMTQTNPLTMHSWLSE
jgi:NAD(P)-dependent dehydrogenase (short-subunit alcohol dehydrogenase family)